MSTYLIVLRRFIKAFLAGGFASLGVSIVQYPGNFKDAHSLLTALGVAFLSGGLLATEKYLNVQPNQ